MWLDAAEHGVEFDGWQGEGKLNVELTWGKDTATILVHPWLAYGTSLGARFLVRKVGAPSGQCATVQRILADDRVVARIDGFARSDGVKGETIIDLAPSSVMRTTSGRLPAQHQGAADAQQQVRQRVGALLAGRHRLAGRLTATCST